MGLPSQGSTTMQHRLRGEQKENCQMLCKYVGGDRSPQYYTKWFPVFPKRCYVLLEFILRKWSDFFVKLMFFLLKDYFLLWDYPLSAFFFLLKYPFSYEIMVITDGGWAFM